MAKIDRYSFNEICMIAKGTDCNGNAVKYRLTYAFGPLAAYDETNGCWVYDWEWV